MPIRDLQRQAVREATLQDAAVAAFETALRRVYRRLNVLLRDRLREWDMDESGRTTRSLANLARVFGLRRQARRLVERAGFDVATAEALAEPLDMLATSVLRGHGREALGPNVRQMLDAWRDLRVADLLGVADDAARVIQRVVLDGTLGLRAVDRLIADVADALSLSQRQARTIYDTAISIYARQVEASTSTGEADELFVYVGPVDGAMREFCEDWVGKVRTKPAIDALDNGQLPNVFISGGGYNCRHKWARVSVLDDELIAIAGTDERAPEIAGLLLRRAA